MPLEWIEHPEAGRVRRTAPPAELKVCLPCRRAVDGLLRTLDAKAAAEGEVSGPGPFPVP